VRVVARRAIVAAFGVIAVDIVASSFDRSVRVRPSSTSVASRVRREGNLIDASYKTPVVCLNSM
jgi:hypothetical protein